MSPGSRPSHGTFPVKCPPSHRSPPSTTITIPKPKRNLPRSAMWECPSDRQLPLRARARGRGNAEMSVRGRGDLATGGRADDEADLQQEGLDYLGQRLRLVVDGRRDGFEPDGASSVLFDDRGEEPAIQSVESQGVHALAIERIARRVGGHHAASLDLHI